MPPSDHAGTRVTLHCLTATLRKPTVLVWVGRACEGSAACLATHRGGRLMTGTPDAIIAPMPHETRKAVFASAIGNVLEWYDFGVYIFLAGTIEQNFFPAGNPTAALLASLAVFGVGFLMR